jgi:hypothetical protein
LDLVSIQIGGELMANISEIIRLVNAARESYGCSPIGDLPRGERASPSFDPLARAFRSGAEDWLFLAVGSYRLRLSAYGRNAMAIAERIHAAWFGDVRMGDRHFAEGGLVCVKLPQPMVEFIREFDSGTLSQYETRVPDIERARLAEIVARTGEAERFTNMARRSPAGRGQHHSLAPQAAQ